MRTVTLLVWRLPAAATAVAVSTARIRLRVRPLRRAREICARSSGENRSVRVARSLPRSVLFADRVLKRLELAPRLFDGAVTTPCAETAQGPRAQETVIFRPPWRSAR